jgi:polysaccharide pyruvyl transferase WcaK-like protein
MKDPVPAARQELRRALRTLEGLSQVLWRVEARLSAAPEGRAVAASGKDGAEAGAEALSEAEQLAALLGCILVDRLHPAIQSLREALA